MKVLLFCILLFSGCAHRSDDVKNETVSVASGVSREAPFPQEATNVPERDERSLAGLTVIDSTTEMPSVGAMLWSTYAQPVVLILAALLIGFGFGLGLKLYRPSAQN